MAHSRNKGAAFERTIAKELHALLGINLRRDLEQYRATDHGDLIADDPHWPWLIECKCYAPAITTCRPAWWQQARTAAQATSKRPVVIWKSNNRPIRVTLNLRDVMECIGRGKWSAENHLIETDLEGFAYIAREGLALHLEAAQ